MTLEDRYVTPTPEGVSLDAVLAGLGSRFAAFLLDSVLQGVFFVLVVIVVVVSLRGGGETSALLAAGILSVVALVDFIGYFIICEMLWSGRSVGKRAAGIRVVRVGGAPVGFWSSLLRNIIRLIDFLPGNLYLVGSVLILATPKNQRLGDILGNTVVIRDRQAAMAGQRGLPFGDPTQWTAPGAFSGTWPPAYGGANALPPELDYWDVSAVNEQELTLVRTFLANRAGYTPEARGRLALQLADRLWPMVAGPVVAPHPEQFLESVLWVKSVRG
jgi:uncharacterized RDD family membrane protein YckC